MKIETTQIKLETTAIYNNCYTVEARAVMKLTFFEKIVKFLFGKDKRLINGLNKEDFAFTDKDGIEQEISQFKQIGQGMYVMNFKNHVPNR